MTRLLIVTTAFCIAIPLVCCSGSRPGNLGIINGKLSACPSTPNCVSSESRDPTHHADPLAFGGAPDEAMARLKQIVLTMPRTRLVAETKGYLYVEFRSALFRFVDDVEFLIDEQQKLIQLRSASRLGSSDLGVNRKRINEIEARWKQSSR